MRFTGMGGKLQACESSDVGFCVKRAISVVLVFLLLSIASCASTVTTEQPARIVLATPEGNLELVVTDLVTALIQIPSLYPAVTTLQFSPPATTLGKKLLVALENAGFGVQLVDADQGLQYVSYAVRSAETEAGIVNDYLIKIGEVELRREYNTTPAGIFPSSLMFLKGVPEKGGITLNEAIFAEQGGGQLFLSGIDPGKAGISDPGAIKEVFTDDFKKNNATKRLDQSEVFGQARRTAFETASKRKIDVSAGLASYKRVVLLFPDNVGLLLGAGNKIAIKNMVSDYAQGDVFRISACDDIDGRNEMAERRAIRVKEEFLSHGVLLDSIVHAPCTRTNFRHQSDDSPTPVTVVQHR